MKKILTITVSAVFAILFMSLLLRPSGYKNTLIGSWQLVKEVVYLSDTTVSGEFPTNSNVYTFFVNDSVEIIYRNIDTTYLKMGWELTGVNEDTIHFSEGAYMYIFSKTETSFRARYPLDVNSNEYVEANFIKIQ